MIDINCHILPSVDDGAKHLTESVEMAKLAVGQGITTIVATPRHNDGKYTNLKNDIIERVRELNDRLKKESINLTILPGQETRISGELIEQFNKGEILTLNNTNKYLMLELPSSHVPLYTGKLVYDLQMDGLIPIIVHPEHNVELLEAPDKLYQLVKKGAYTLVTAASVAGKFGKKIKRFSLELIEANLVHFIASDAHDIKGRTFAMKAAYEVIRKEFGQEKMYTLMENAKLLVDDQTIMHEVPERIKRKRMFGLIK